MRSVHVDGYDISSDLASKPAIHATITLQSVPCPRTVSSHPEFQHQQGSQGTVQRAKVDHEAPRKVGAISRAGVQIGISCAADPSGLAVHLWGKGFWDGWLGGDWGDGGGGIVN